MNIMVKVVLIEKSGNLKETNVRNLLENELYKKCGYKTDSNFKERAVWNVKVEGKTHTVKCYAKDEGRANMENKYDLPPPVDTALYFGTIILVKRDENKFEDLSIDLWNMIYEKLFGGFEDLAATAEEDDKEIDELEKVPSEMKTKDGYLKDGFVVDSENEDSNDDDEEEDSDEDSWADEGSELDYENYEYSDEDE